MQVSLDQAYREACQALGEAIVRERLLQQALQAASQPDNAAPNPQPTVV